MLMNLLFVCLHLRCSTRTNNSGGQLILRDHITVYIEMFKLVDPFAEDVVLYNDLK